MNEGPHGGPDPNKRVVIIDLLVSDGLWDSGAA